MVKAAILSPISVSSLSRISEDHSLEGVLVTVHVRVVGHVNDVLRLYTSKHEVVISTASDLFMKDLFLDPYTVNRVVSPSLSSTENHGILLSGSNGRNKSNQKKSILHWKELTIKKICEMPIHRAFQSCELCYGTILAFPVLASIFRKENSFKSIGRVNLYGNVNH